MSRIAWPRGRRSAPSISLTATAFALLLARSAPGAVLGPPEIMKSFGPATIAVGGTSTLSIVLTNPNGIDLIGVAVSDTFPAALVVASPPSAMNGCGGTLTASAGANSIALSNVTLPGSASCTVSVQVTATTVGTSVNTTDPVSSANAGTGGTASATLVSLTPQGGECASPSECATGFCADGVCCNSACDGPDQLCNVAGQVGTCTGAVAPAPALAPWGLMIAGLILIAIAGSALYRRA